MPNILQNIARENFRNSSFLTQPGKERRTHWEYVALPSSPYRRRSDSSDGILERRNNAVSRNQSKFFSFRSLLNVFLRR